MEQILSIIWFVGFVGSIVLSITATSWAAENRNDAHFKVMACKSREEFFLYKKERETWALITMRLLDASLALAIISLIAIISTIFV